MGNLIVDFKSGLRHSLSDFHQVIADFGDGEHRNRRLAGPLGGVCGRDCNEAARQFMTLSRHQIEKCARYRDPDVTMHSVPMLADRPSDHGSNR